MKVTPNIEHLIEKVWEEPLYTELASKKVDVSIYKKLSQEIPDKSMIIKEVLPTK
ncbi:hypothetical protein [Vreelandella titanicae]|uniref:hypothetical protein n=1 Tax=Vreelandella titanicae TaxID=664683 RepID=UPI0039BF2CF0